MKKTDETVISPTKCYSNLNLVAITSKNVVLVVLISRRAHFDETGEPIILDECVYKVLVILEDLLQGEQGSSQLSALRVQ